MPLARGIAAVAALVVGASSGVVAPNDPDEARPGRCNEERVALAVLVDEDRDTATRYLAAHHLDVAVSGDPDGDRVVAQAPEAAARVCPGDVVTLELR